MTGDQRVIHVLAFITTRPGERETVLAAFREIVPLVHAEAGCLEYGPAVDLDGAPEDSPSFGADTFVVIEKWESAAALAAHAASPHMAAYAARTREMVASRAVYVLAPA